MWIYEFIKRFCKLVDREIGPSQSHLSSMFHSHTLCVSTVQHWMHDCTFYHHESNVKLIFRSLVINYGEDLSRTKRLHVMYSPFETIPAVFVFGFLFHSLHQLLFRMFTTGMNNTHLIGIPLSERRFTFNSKLINKFFFVSTRRICSLDRKICLCACQRLSKRISKALLCVTTCTSDFIWLHCINIDELPKAIDFGREIEKKKHLSNKLSKPLYS